MPRPRASEGGLITRRALLRAGAGATVLATRAAIPAWAKPIAQAHAAGLRRPDTRPFPHLPAGHPSMPQIEHIVVLMMENHSFDNLLGMVPQQVPGRARVDGLTIRQNNVVNVNPDSNGNPVAAFHAASPCQENGEPGQSWDASHTAYNAGGMDGFVRASDRIAMAYWDQTDLPFTYSLARHFPIGERYFCSTLAQTYPNRRYFFTGTSSGLVATNGLTFSTPAANGTIFDRLDAHRISWGVYFQNLPSYAIVPGAVTAERQAKNQHPYAEFLTDAARGRLPKFSFIDPDYLTASEEDPQDIQVGERLIAEVVTALIHSPNWHQTALFITYDEHGGYYDHVPPPAAIAPDSIAPILGPYDIAGAFDRYGFRVPLIVVSPWAKRNYISRTVQDHTSLTAFIERKWNLPAMTYRDANAAPMTDYFDFRTSKPAFKKPPKLARPPALAPGLARCAAAGLTPPLPA